MKSKKEQEATNTLRPLGIVIRKTDYEEYRVNFRGGNEATAYYTNDLTDAVETGQDMAYRSAKYK